MMRTKILLGTFFLASVFVFSGCLKSDDEELQDQEKQTITNYIKYNSITVQPSSDGLYYIETKPGTGLTPADTDFVLVNTSWSIINSYSATLVRTSNLEEATTSKVVPLVSYHGPVKVYLPYFSIRGLAEGLLKMKAGGSADLIVPSSLAFDGYTFAEIPKYSPLLVKVELLRVIKDPVADDKVFVNRYLDSLQFSESDITGGIFLKTDVEGEGDYIQSNDSVYAEYICKPVDTIFSFGQTEYIKAKFIYDQEGPDSLLFPGIKVAFGKLKKGAEARVLIPYNMAAGKKGYGYNSGIVDIPPYASLFYRIRVKDVKKNY
jgi:FKBP-type peptidyl-prolyl cis-trans isomerase FkpA